MGWEETSKAPGCNGKLLAMRSNIRRSKNWPEDLINSRVAPSWERDMVSSCWLPADLAVLVEADLEVVTAAVLEVSPELEQAVTVPLVVGRGSLL